MTWFSRLPDSAKGLVTAFGAMTTAFMSGAWLALTIAGYGSLPGDVAAQAVINVRQDSEITTLQRQQIATDRRSEYTLCLLEGMAGTGTRTATQCAIEYGRIP